MIISLLDWKVDKTGKIFGAIHPLYPQKAFTVAPTDYPGEYEAYFDAKPIKLHHDKNFLLHMVTALVHLQITEIAFKDQNKDIQPNKRSLVERARKILENMEIPELQDETEADII